MAVIAEGDNGRVFLEPDKFQEDIATQAVPKWKPETPLPDDPRNFWTLNYGLTTFGDLFTPRQLTALNTFSDLVIEASEKCHIESLAAGRSSDPTSLAEGGSGALAYAQAVAVYLAFLVDQVANHGSSICGWNNPNTQLRSVFSRQALPMTWDYAEANVFSDSSGSFANLFDRQIRGFEGISASQEIGFALQADASTQEISLNKIISTDPPYYDNITYADLSDFFYVWMRRTLRPIYPSLFATLTVPKAEELIASPYRHGGKTQAEQFFLEGMTSVMHGLATKGHPGFPVSIYYAFKQSETDESDGTSSSGWQTFVDAVIRSGFAITGTWPMRTEKQGRSIGNGTNSLASSIILVCRRRDADAPTISRREFLRELHSVLPDALIDMTRGGVNSPVAPVDLSQSIIGPGMGIFSKYRAVLEADGTPMTVRTAMQLINRFLADDDFDPETQFCVQWFETNYWKPGQYGVADVAARAKGTSVDALFRAGVLNSGGGEVQLLRWNELPTDWKPDPDHQTPVWEALHQLIRNLNMHGEQLAGALLAEMSSVSGPVRTLAYRLYTLCERKGLAEEARFYNELIGAWAAIEVVADEIGPTEKQGELF
jgi:putative DNA methylase